MVKNLPVIQETRSLSQEDPLEKKVATPCSILAWRIPWTEAPGHFHFHFTSAEVYNYTKDKFCPDKLSRFVNELYPVCT